MQFLKGRKIFRVVSSAGQVSQEVIKPMIVVQNLACKMEIIQLSKKTRIKESGLENGRLCETPDLLASNQISSYIHVL